MFLIPVSERKWEIYWEIEEQIHKKVYFKK